MTDNDRPAATDRIECPAAKDPVIRLFLAGLVLLGFGLYGAYDAFWAKDAKGQPLYSVQKDAGGYYFNVLLGLAAPPAGILALIWADRMRRRRLIADADGLGFAGREKVAWSRLRRLVPRGKGLLDVYYDRGDGSARLRLDSWKLKNFNELVTFIEAHAPKVPVEARESTGES